MNVTDVVNRVKRIFGDEAGVQITDVDLVRWINDAQVQIGLANEGLLETSATANIVASQAEYNVPADMSVLRSLTYNGFRVRVLSFAEFNEYIDGYSASASLSPYGTGIPEVFMVWQNLIRLFPTPDTSITNGMKIYYVKNPATVTSLADDLTVPIQYHNSVVDYCLTQAYELDEDLQKASYNRGKFDETMMKLQDRNKWTSQEYYPRITTLPEDESYGGGFWQGGY